MNPFGPKGQQVLAGFHQSRRQQAGDPRPRGSTALGRPAVGLIKRGLFIQPGEHGLNGLAIRRVAGTDDARAQTQGGAVDIQACHQGRRNRFKLPVNRLLRGQPLHNRIHPPLGVQGSPVTPGFLLFDQRQGSHLGQILIGQPVGVTHPPRRTVPATDEPPKFTLVDQGQHEARAHPDIEVEAVAHRRNTAQQRESKVNLPRPIPARGHDQRHRRIVEIRRVLGGHQQHLPAAGVRDVGAGKAFVEEGGKHLPPGFGDDLKGTVRNKSHALDAIETAQALDVPDHALQPFFPGGRRLQRLGAMHHFGGTLGEQGADRLRIQGLQFQDQVIPHSVGKCIQGIPGFWRRDAAEVARRAG